MITSSVDKVSLLVENQFPLHISVEYKLFIEFVRRYYEYMEQEYGAHALIDNVKNKFDLDDMGQEFMEMVRNTLTFGFNSNIVANEKLILKHIKDLYLSKGSEKSLKLLFNLAFGEPVRVYYPSEFLLIPSDGEWIQQVSIKTTKSIGDPFKLVGAQIRGLTSNNIAVVERVDKYYQLEDVVYEIFLNRQSMTGNFLTDTLIGNETNTIKVVPISGLNNYPGRFKNTKGMLSNVNRIQDGFFYQAFSYVIASGVSTDRWEAMLKTIIHPSGMKYFGEVEIADTLRIAPPTNSYVGIVASATVYGEDSFTINSDLTSFNQDYVQQTPELYIDEDYVSSASRTTTDNIAVNDVDGTTANPNTTIIWL